MGHTPGPWVANDQGQIFGPQWMVAELVAGDSEGEIRANARLIAAAPELLEACELAVAAMGTISAADYIRAAIAKAKGEFPSIPPHQEYDGKPHGDKGE